MTTAYEIAGEVATLLNATACSVTFKAARTLMPELERTDKTATVQVQPWSESEEPADRGDMQNQRREVNVIVQTPLEEGLDEELAMTWLGELKAAFNETRLDLGAGDVWRWDGNETVSLFDTDALKNKRQFLSVFRASFFNFA